MDLIDDEDPVLAWRRCVTNRLVELAHVIHTSSAGRIDFLHIGGVSRNNLATRGTLVARCLSRAGIAVEAAGNDPGERRLAGAARAGQQKGMRKAPRTNGIAQGLCDVLLPGDLIEVLRSPLSSDDLITQGLFLPGWFEGSLRGAEEPSRSGRFDWPWLSCLSCLAWLWKAVSTRDRRANPPAARNLLRLLPSGSDRVHRAPNSSGPCDPPSTRPPSP